MLPIRTMTLFFKGIINYALVFVIAFIRINQQCSAETDQRAFKPGNELSFLK
jgi:hypothetical protein